MTASGVPDLNKVRRSHALGARRLRYPGRQDYIRCLKNQGFIERASDLNQLPELVADVQKHWHASGQNGCRFAQLLSRAPSDYGWRIVVVTRGHEKMWIRKVIPEIHDHITRALRHSATSALSLIFPGVTQAWELAELLHELDGMTKCTVEETGEPVMLKRIEYVPVGMRVLLNHDGVRSWALGFGPFAFLPPTRRAPFTEIALATKPKTFPLRDKRLNPNPLLAHLADVDILLDDKTFSTYWSATEVNRSDLLSGQVVGTARARVTFIVPRKQWDRLRWR